MMRQEHCTASPSTPVTLSLLAGLVMHCKNTTLSTCLSKSSATLNLATYACSAQSPEDRKEEHKEIWWQGNRVFSTIYRLI